MKNIYFLRIYLILKFSYSYSHETFYNHYHTEKIKKMSKHPSYEQSEFPTTHEEFYLLSKDQNVFLSFCLEKNIIDYTTTCINPMCPRPQNNSVTILKGNYRHKCKTRNCLRHWSTRNNLFVFDDKNKAKLSHEKILEIIWYWA